MTSTVARPGGPSATAPDHGRLERSYSRLGVLLVVPTLLFFIAVIIYPLMSGIALSFFDIYTPALSGPFVGTANYTELLAQREFWISLRNNFVWTIGTLTLQVVVGVAVAMMLHQNMAFRALARSLVLFPYLLSTVVSVLAWQWLFNDLYGFFNGILMHWEWIEFPIDWLGSMPNAMITLILVGTWKYFPFVVIAVLARLQTIPPSLYEAAEIDGASPWERFWDVTIPQLRSVLVIVILLRGIWDFKEFDLIYLLTGGGPVFGTQTLPLLVYKQAFPLFKMGMAAAVAVVMFLIMLAFMLLYLRMYGRKEEDV